MKRLATILICATCAAAAEVPLVYQGPNEDAPVQVQEFGRLVGHWTCTSENRQADGTWQASPGKATWSWYYVLEGFAIQDVWRPDREQNPTAAMGTNLRTYDPESGFWDVVWTTQQATRFERYRASARGGDVHMFAERPASKTFPSHLMHITFHNISDDHFDWKYEASGLTDGQNWQEQSRLSCDRGASPG